MLTGTVGLILQMLRELLLQYKVLFVRDQDITREQHREAPERGLVCGRVDAVLDRVDASRQARHRRRAGPSSA